MVEELSEEQKADVEDRKKQFIERYEALTKELMVDFAQFPMYVPIGNGLFATLMQAELRDKKYLTPLSPMQPT